MNLPVSHPLPPMEARTAPALPKEEHWYFEPKWDGFRCLIFRDGEQAELQSKNQKPLGRYFPEVLEATLQLDSKRFVLDGELIIPAGRRLDFELLQLRLHPAESRVRKLAIESPAMFVAFDLLAAGDTSYLDQPFSGRRKLLESFAAKMFKGTQWKLSPVATDRNQAMGWLTSSGPSLDGVVCKDVNEPYRSGERAGMIKVKNFRTADCVVGGFRVSADGRGVASLLLGLYDDQKKLNYVGHLSGLPNTTRVEMLQHLQALEGPPGFTGRAPGGPSRWDPSKSGDYCQLPHDLVIEVEYDHYTGGRFRHGTSFKRWRPDKSPVECVEDQIAAHSDLGLNLLH